MCLLIYKEREKLNTVFRDSEAGIDIVTTSTMKGEEQETVGNVQYHVIPIEISAASHPFYTGQERILDTQGRVERFRMRQQKAKK